ncbi:MAG: ABC transporter ATP-binding protein [Pseudorhodoplanes sp.]
MNVNAVLNLVGVTAILPFIQLLIEPDPLAGDGVVARLLRGVGFKDASTAIVWVGLGLVAIMFVKSVFSLFQSRAQNTFCARAETRLATELLGRVANAPYVWLITQNTAILRDLVTVRVTEWSRHFLRQLLQLTNDLMFLVFAFALLIVANPLTGLVVTLAALVFCVGFIAIVTPRIASHAAERRRGMRLSAVEAEEAIKGGRDIRISGMSAVLVKAFGRDYGLYAMSEARSQQWQLLPRYGIEVVGVGTLVLVAIVGLWLNVERTEIATLLALYAVVAMRAIPIVSQALHSFASLGWSLKAVDDLQQLIAALPSSSKNSVRHDREAFSRSPWQTLEFRGVDFTYPNAPKSALSDINLTIRRRVSYGVVGPSGSGKSTFADLITGLLEPTHGGLYLDGSRLDGDRLAYWRHCVGYVSQSPFLLDASIRENVVFGAGEKPDARARVMEAIEAAGLGDFVRSLPDGLDALVGERGARISGGQAQRIAIARALYRDADLLVLDEATSALDSITENDINDAILGLKGRITIVVIAHRLSTVARCDELLVFENGTLVGAGEYEHVAAQTELFRKLFDAQVSALS